MGGFIGRVLLGIAMAVAGFFIVKKADDVAGFVGRSAWAERNFSGGTATLIKLIGLVVIFLGFAWITQLHESILGFFAGIIVPGI